MNMESPGDILKSYLTDIKNKIAERMVSSGRSVSGRSVSSLKVEVNDGHGILWGLKSFLAMEKGRGPGPVPRGFTEIIMAWAQAKGISIRAQATGPKDPESALRSFAGAVAYNIMKKGTRLYRTKQYDDIFSSVVKEELEKMEEHMAVSLLDQIAMINDNLQ